MGKEAFAKSGLVLSRKVGESTAISCRCGCNSSVTVIDIDRGKVRLMFSGERDLVRFIREELLERKAS